MPLDTQANDLWHWHVNLATGTSTGPRRGSAGHAALVSPGIVDMPDDALHLGRALMALSPSGHAILAFEPKS